MKRLAKNVIFGMAGGIAGTYVISKVFGMTEKFVSLEDHLREAKLGEKPSNAVLAEKLSRNVLHLSPEAEKKFAVGIHWGYGLALGALYGLVHDKYPKLTRFGAIPYGLFLAVAANEAVTTVFKLSAPPQKHPMSTHLTNLAGHVAYAAAADRVFRVLRHSFA